MRRGGFVYPVPSRLLLLALWLALALAMPFKLLWWLVLSLAGHERAWRVTVGEDQTYNALAGGSEDETISSRAGKAARQGKHWGCVLCRLLDRLDPGHCERAIEKEECHQ